MADRRPLEEKDMYRVRIISDPQIAPDGSRVAFVLRQMDEEKNDYLSNIYVWSTDGTVHQFTSGDKDSAPRWSPDGKWLAFLSGRKETAQIQLLRASGGEAVALTDRKMGAGTPVWSPDSSRIAFAAPVSTEPEEDDKEKEKDRPLPTKVVRRASYKSDGTGYVGNRRTHLFVADIAAKTVEQLTEGDHNNGHPAWSPDSRYLAFGSNRYETWDVSTENQIHLIPAGGGEAQQVTHGGAYGLPRFSPDGSRIAFVGNADPDDVFAPARLYSCDRSGGDQRDELGEWDGHLGNQALSDVVDTEHEAEYEWRADGLYFLGTVGGEANIYRTDGRVSPVTSGTQVVIGFSTAADGTIAYAAADSTHPAEIFLLKGGETTQITHENGWLNEVAVGTPERVTYVGAEGKESEGWLLAPAGAESGKHPLIVYIHGGPQLAHGEVFFFEYQWLAGQGFGVFFPNLHGSAGYGREYQTSIHRRWGSVDYEDLLAGTEAAASRDWVDRSRIGIAGGSYGGYMTSWAIGHGDQYRAAVVERPLVNIVSFMGTSDGGWVWNRVFGIYPEDDVQALWDMSPMKYVGNVRIPTMVIHSERDDRTPIEQGEQYFNGLRRSGVESKFVMFPEESHGLSRAGKPSRRVERLGHIGDWFREHL